MSDPRAPALEPGWLARQLAKNQDEADLWPGWMRRDAAHRAMRDRRPAPTYRQPPPEELIPQLRAEIDAQAARLAAVEQERDRMRAALEAIRDQGRDYLARLEVPDGD